MHHHGLIVFALASAALAPTAFGSDRHRWVETYQGSSGAVAAVAGACANARSDAIARQASACFGMGGSAIQRDVGSCSCRQSDALPSECIVTIEVACVDLPPPASLPAQQSGQAGIPMR